MAAYDQLSFLLRSCTQSLPVEPDWFGCVNQVQDVMKTRNVSEDGPQLALRVVYAPTNGTGAGARFGPYAKDDDIAITLFEQCQGHGPLRWRQSDSHARDRRALAAWPRDDQRFGMQRNFWRAKVMVSDGHGGYEEYWSLMSCAVAAKDRTVQQMKTIVDDAITAATFADAFNMEIAKLHSEEVGGDPDPYAVVGVRVCVPVVCQVLGGRALDAAQPGQALLLCLYPHANVQKFVFEGSEDFNELPQAFFHFCVWSSAGKQMVSDIQGVEDEDGDFLIVDPFVLGPTTQREVPNLGEFVANARGAVNAGSVENLRFETWHRRCGQLCKAFDPHRRSAQVRRACGLGLPSCGIGNA